MHNELPIRKRGRHSRTSDGFAVKLTNTPDDGRWMIFVTCAIGSSTAQRCTYDRDRYNCMVSYTNFWAL